MKHKKFLFLTLASAAMVITSCTNTVSYDLEKEAKKVSVSAVFSTADSVHSLYIYPQKGINDTTKVKKIIAANVDFYDGDQKIAFSVDSAPNRYCYILKYAIQPLKTYKVVVQYNGLTSTALTTVPVIPIPRTNKNIIVVDTNVTLKLTLKEIIDSLVKFDKISFFIENARPTDYYSMSIRCDVPKSEQKSIFKSMGGGGGGGQGPNQNFHRPGVTFQGDRNDITLRRISSLGKHTITLKRIDDIYANILKSSQNQGGMDQNGQDLEIDVEDMTVAPCNFDNSYGYIASSAMTTFEIEVQAAK